MGTNEREVRWLLQWALEQLETYVDYATGCTLEELFSSPDMRGPVTCSRFRRAVLLSGYFNEEYRRKFPCEHKDFVASITPDADGNVFECWSCGERATVNKDGNLLWREAY